LQMSTCDLSRLGEICAKASTRKFTHMSPLRRVSAGEAQGMDPQNRVLLEQSAVALTDAAACAGAGLGGTKTGVYVGCMYQEYMQVHNLCAVQSLSPGREAGICKTPMSNLGTRSRHPHPVSSSAHCHAGQALCWCMTSGCAADALQPRPEDQRHHRDRQWVGVRDGPPVVCLRPARALRQHRHRLLLQPRHHPPRPQGERASFADTHLSSRPLIAATPS